MKALVVVGLGRSGYVETLALQRAAARARLDRTLADDLLLLVEHPPVVTLGRGFEARHLLTPVETLRHRGIEVFSAERGGDVTFHGPGQIVGYPIFDLTGHTPDLHLFLRQLEETLIRALDTLGVAAGRRPGLTGVWTPGDRKIASIGIHVRKWVTWHGFALNVTTDLSFFDLMVPCGIDQVVMTSVQRELGSRAPRDLWGQALDAVLLGCTEVFDLQPQAMAEEDLRRLLGHHLEEATEDLDARPELIEP